MVILGGLEPKVSRPDNWQTKFTHICQDIRDIKSNSYSKQRNIQKRSIKPTNSSSTKALDNHMPQDSYKNGGDGQDASYSPCKPSPERTRGHNSDTRTSCGALLYDASPTPPQLFSLPPSYPESPLYTETPLLPAVSIAATSWKDDTAVPKESPSPADTSVNSCQSTIFHFSNFDF